MKWLITSVSMSVATRRRTSKAGTALIETDDWIRLGILKSRNPTALEIERAYEEQRSGKETITKVVDVRPADAPRPRF
jgi:hypothetical protein